MRKSAAIAICSAPRPRPEVIAALVIGLNSDDATVIGHASEKARTFLPPVETVIQSLIRNLRSADSARHMSASDVLEAYGASARPYALQIVDAVLQSETDREYKLYVLYDVGLEGLAAEKLAGAVAEFTDKGHGIAAVCLLDHPELLKHIASQFPKTISALQDHLPRLYSYLCGRQSVADETRSWLANSDKLRPFVMGMLREKRFVDDITAMEAAADDCEPLTLQFFDEMPDVVIALSPRARK